MSKAYRTIVVPQDVYEILSSHKRDRESFAAVIKRKIPKLARTGREVLDSLKKESDEAAS
jgi:predicted CopG family antitoxin